MPASVWAPLVTDNTDPSIIQQASASSPPPAPITMPNGGSPPQVWAPTPPPQVQGPGPSPMQQQIDSTRANLQRVQWKQSHPWATPENHPGTLGKIAHVLSVAGNIAGNIVAPGVMANIPGTQLNMQRDAMGQTQLLNEELGEQSQNDARDAGTTRMKAETAAMPAQEADRHAQSAASVRHTEDESDALESAPAQEPSLAQAYGHAVTQALKAGRDPQQDPVVQHLSDAIVSLQPGQNKGPEAPKTIQLEVGGKPHQMAFNPKSGKYDLDQGESGEKPPTVKVSTGNDAALDREAKQFGAAHSKSLDASNAQLEKIADARAMINGNAEAQGLGIPKVLTALVGGQGTGVRITQAELTSIAHARGLSGDVEGTLNKLSGKGALSKAQQQQLTQIMDDVRARIVQKQAIASDALDTINGASSRDQIIAADKAARKKLSDMETGGGAQGGSGISVTAPDNSVHSFRDQASADKFKQLAGIK